MTNIIAVFVLLHGTRGEEPARFDKYIRRRTSEFLLGFGYAMDVSKSTRIPVVLFSGGGGWVMPHTLAPAPKTWPPSNTIRAEDLRKSLFRHF